MASSSSKTTVKVSKAKTTDPKPAKETTTLTGRLCADSVLRHTNSGKAVSTIRIAVNDGPEPQFHSVVVWNRTAESVCKYLRKGRLVEVEGHSQERTWQAPDGSQRTATEVSAFRVRFLWNRTSVGPALEVAS